MHCKISSAGEREPDGLWLSSDIGEAPFFITGQIGFKHGFVVSLNRASNKREPSLNHNGGHSFCQ